MASAFVHVIVVAFCMFAGFSTGLGQSTAENPDFISIDCGASSTYIDKTSNIAYQTDEGYTISGTSHRILAGYNSSIQQLDTLRSFPDGTRNCYTLRPRQGKNNRYLIRTLFKYGNYDGLDKPPQFDLYIGVSKLFRLSTGFSDQEHWIEIVQVPTTNYISFCLVNVGLGVPFISLLELRLLDKSIYSVESTDTLGLFTRYDIGSSSAGVARYHDDAYDRFWDPVKNPNNFFKNWDLISTNLTIETQKSLYKPPSTMLQTAAQATNASVAIEYLQIPFIKEDIYSAFLHFMEIQELKPGQKREMNIYSNDQLLFGPLTLDYLVPLTVGPIQLPLVGDQLQFSIRPTNSSGLPPILNGCEIYRTYQLDGMPTNSNDIDAIMEIKETYRVNRNWQGDPCVETSWDGLNCTVETNPRITQLNLSSSGLTGRIAASISNLTSLISIDLSYNNLTGPLPNFLAELPSLKALNLTKNQLTGSIPQVLLDKSRNGTLSLSLSGNPYLCQSGSCGGKRTLIIAASTSVLVFVLIVLGLAFWRIKKKGFPVFTKKKNNESIESIESKTRVFSHSQIISITDNFKKIIGEGGFGKVYLGTIRNGDKVAVKLLSSKSEQGPQEFLQEVKLLIRVHHGNLVKLIGYCNQANHMGLIYEYMPNGNLKELLHYNNAAILKWINRVKIAIQIAQGLDYLHNNCTPPILHRDLKTVNILLDENLQAKISDFGLSRAFKNEDTSHISTTQAAGTPAYIDPEYIRSGRFNRKSDVYSYGVILLEIVTGQPAIIIRDGGATSIMNWVKPLIDKGDIQAVVDPRLAGEYNVDAAWKIIETAFLCLEETAIQRPEINYVLDELKQCAPMDSARTRNVITSTAGDRSSLEYEAVDIESDLAFAYPIAR